MMRIFVALLLALSAAPAWSQSPLVSNNVFVAQPAEATASAFGVVGIPGSEVPGLAALGNGKDGKPVFQILGCRFRIELQQPSDARTRIASIFSKKLTSIPSADPPSAGYGILTHATSVGIVDPVTSIGCSDNFRYFVFLYRQRASTGNAAIEALVFEFDSGHETALQPEKFSSAETKPSVQARDAVRASRGLYRTTFRSEEDVKLNAMQQRESQGLVLTGLKFYFTGVP